MADEAFLDRESLRCSICQDLFRNPVIIPCGHSFCKDCITRLWDQDVSRCPQCKQTFNNRPDWLHAKELSEKLMKMRTRAEEEAEDVSCDSCSSTTTKAIRSCLTCLASYCSTHLEQHDELHARRKHQLTDATDLQNKICSQHGKLIDIFCRTDQQCVCVLCAIHEHKSHDTISASDVRADRQRKLMETRVKFLQNIQDREKDYKELTQTEESIRRSAQTAVTESERIFSEVLQSLQKTSCRVKELIADQQRAELNHIEELQEKVQQKIADMKMKVSELDQFMTTEDHIHFLQNYPSDCGELISEEFEDLSSISEHPDAFFHNVRMLVSKMQERLLDVTKTTEMEIKIKSVKVLPPVGGTVKLFATPAFGKKDERWNCDICLVTNEGTTSHCVACYEPKPNMKSKFCFGSFANQRAATLFKDSGLRFQKDQSKASTCGFDFGNASSSVFKFDVEQYKKKENEAVATADKTSHDGNPLSTSSDLCGSVQLDQKNVFRFGELVKGFNFSFQYVPSKSTSVLNQSEASCPDDEEETHEPAVLLPDVIEISTGEEYEQVVFSHRAKLYRFDKELLQWKERGVGELKILENDKPRRARLVMRREQVLKLCANHWITPNMKLEPMKATENAWTWNAFDFADGEGRDQTLAVRFKLQESADAFRKIFEEAVATASSVPERGKSTQDQCDADVEIVFERKPTAEQAELATRLMLPHTFFCYRNQLGYLSDEDDDEDFEEAVKSLKGKLYPGLSIQGDASAGHDANLPQDNAGAATETQSDGEEEDDDDDEAPVHVELPSVEENEEEMLFKEWTKLYRWDCDIKKWKARSEGDIKILFHPSRKLYRVFMWQEGDKKVCVNHCITRAIHLKRLNTSTSAVTWTAADSSEGDAVLRQFAVKFKTPELAVSFTKTFTDCQSRKSEFMQPLKK